jgi:hypothetical protein
MLKVFNFNVFSDLNASIIFNLTAAQLEGASLSSLFTFYRYTSPLLPPLACAYGIKRLASIS